MNIEISTAVSRGDISFLIKIIYGDSLDSRRSAIEAIAEIGGIKARRALIAISRDRNRLRPEVRSLALEKLGGLCAPDEYLSILGEFITGENPKLVMSARRLLRDADPDGFAKCLVEHECLDHRAISIYGRYLEASAVPLLDRFLEARIDANEVCSTMYWGKVYVATAALGKIGGDAAFRSLEKLECWCDSWVADGAGLLEKERVHKIRRALEISLGRAGKG